MVHGDEPRGGSVGLAELIDEHGEALIADFDRYHQHHRLRDVFTGVLDVRDAIRFINWSLPDDGAFAASCMGGRDHRGWGRDRHMAADRYDVAVAAIAGKKAKFYPRPETAKKRPSVLDAQRPTPR